MNWMPLLRSNSSLVYKPLTLLRHHPSLLELHRVRFMWYFFVDPQSSFRWQWSECSFLFLRCWTRTTNESARLLLLVDMNSSGGIIEINRIGNSSMFERRFIDILAYLSWLLCHVRPLALVSPLLHIVVINEWREKHSLLTTETTIDQVRSIDFIRLSLRKFKWKSWKSDVRKQREWSAPMNDKSKPSRRSEE